MITVLQKNKPIVFDDMIKAVNFCSFNDVIIDEQGGAYVCKYDKNGKTFVDLQGLEVLPTTKGEM